MIEIWTEELPINWVWDADRFVGGTPEFIFETAKVLSKKDEIVVYYDGKPMYIDGVYYVGRSSFRGSDIVLACNSRPPKNGKYSIYYTNWYNQRQDYCLDYDERIVLSKYHQQLFGYNSRIVPHSCWPKKLKDGVKKPLQCLYSSSPDRGLDFLKEIWPIVKRETGASLIYTYKDSISEEAMCDLYKESKFWLHPGEGIELFCISAVKAQVAGCIPVVVPNMALEETVKFGIKTTKEKYLYNLIEAIKNPPMVKEVDFGDWESVTKDLFKNTEVF